MKCKIHGREMTKSAKSGWNGGEELVCPKCAEEKVRATIRGGQPRESEEKGRAQRRAAGW